VIPLEMLVALAAGPGTIALAERAGLRHDPFHRPCTVIAARLGAERLPGVDETPKGNGLAGQIVPMLD
jgi:hypothetical protein